MRKPSPRVTAPLLALAALGFAGRAAATEPTPAPRENCVPFDPATTEVKNVDGNWKVLDRGRGIFDFGARKDEAEKALRIIRFYQANQSCFSGRPGRSFQYLLVGDFSPAGAIPGEDCVGFNLATIEVRQVSGSWKIVDGSRWMFDFGANEAEARNALAIIKKHGFTSSCFGGRPNASFPYMRK